MSITAGTRPSAVAAKYGYRSCVEILIEAGANVCQPHENEADSALFMAVYHGQYDIAQRLFDLGCQPFNRLLYFAVEKGYTSMVELMLDTGIDVDATHQPLNRTPLFIASWFGYDDIVKIFIENGADVNRRFHRDYSSLLKAVEENNINSVRLLLENGADIDAQTNDGRSALDYATADKNSELYQLLMKHKH